MLKKKSTKQEINNKFLNIVTKQDNFKDDNKQTKS